MAACAPWPPTSPPPPATKRHMQSQRSGWPASPLARAGAPAPAAAGCRATPRVPTFALPVRADAALFPSLCEHDLFCFPTPPLTRRGGFSLSPTAMLTPCPSAHPPPLLQPNPNRTRNQLRFHCVAASVMRAPFVRRSGTHFQQKVSQKLAPCYSQAEIACQLYCGCCGCRAGPSQPLGQDPLPPLLYSPLSLS